MKKTLKNKTKKKKHTGHTDEFGVPILLRMFNDKILIRKHLKNGGELSDLKDQFPFATPI
jgi:hypothetical protein